MTRFCLALITLTFASGSALAEEQYCTGDGEAMPEEQIINQLNEQGYQKIRGLDREHGCFEAKGFDQDGNRVEVYVEPATGEIVKIKKS